MLSRRSEDIDKIVSALMVQGGGSRRSSEVHVMLQRTDGNGEANYLLSLLEYDIRREITNAGTIVKLVLGDILVSAGAPIESVFFCHPASLLSLLFPDRDEKQRRVLSAMKDLCRVAPWSAQKQV